MAKIFLQIYKMYKKFEIKNKVSNFTGNYGIQKNNNRYGNQKVRKGQLGKQETSFP